MVSLLLVRATTAQLARSLSDPASIHRWRTVSREGVRAEKPPHRRGLNNEATNTPATLPHPIHLDPHNRFFLLSLCAPPPQIQSPSSTWQTTSKDSCCWNIKQSIFSVGFQHRRWSNYQKKAHSPYEPIHLNAPCSECPQGVDASGTIHKRKLISKPWLDFDSWLAVCEWRGCPAGHFRVLSPE